MISNHSNFILFFAIFICLSHSTILITSPAINPFNQSKIPYSYTNVGTIPYGKTLAFDLKQLPQFQPCITPNKTNITLLTDPTYLLVDSSKTTCSFVTQAINAQQIGAKGIVFVSDYVDYFGKMVLIDDGNGRKVHISVLMIDTKNYQSLKTIKNVQIKVQYQVHKTDKVNLTYFLSASGRANYIFLRQFEPYYQKIADYINFKPLYLTIQCAGCEQKDCLISKDYCMFDLDTYSDSVGQYILKEGIKQYSIWKNYGTRKYLKYMKQFDKFCTTNWIASEDCGDKILRDMELFRPTMTQSPSSIMQQWKKQEIASGFLSTPQISLNSQIYAGTQNSTQLFNSICEYLTNPPAQCTGKQVNVNKSSKVGWIIVSIIIACLLSIAIGLLIYRKCINKQLTKDMFSKVNELVAKYATKVSQHNKKRKEKIKMRLTQQL